MKHLSLLIRIVVAALGVTYIVWMVDWKDQVEAPADTTLPNGRVLVEADSFPVVSGIYDPADPVGELVVQIDDQGNTLPIPIAALDTKGNGLRFAPGIVTMIRNADFKWLALGLLLVGTIYPIQMLRWWLLLRARSLNVPFYKAFRLTMVGSFFNYCMPGTTGGDVIKAYYAAKGSARRADAVMSVIFDRIAGLLGLIVLAGTAGLFMLEDPAAAKITQSIWALMGAGIVGSIVYFSHTIRRAVGLEWLIRKLPGKKMFVSIDEAAVAYREHWVTVVIAVAISLPVHLALAIATAIAGRALGVETPIGYLLIVIPVCFLVGAIPISPQGIGVMEAFALAALVNPPVAFPNQIVGMLIMIRLYQVFYSLWGSVFLLKGDIHLHPQQPAVDAPPASVPLQAEVAAVSEVA